MKKLLALLTVLLLTAFLAACGGGNEEDTSNENATDDTTAESEESADETEATEENIELTIGASSTPHAEILQEAQPLLEDEGISINIEEYQDYVLPNDDLENGTLDANYFQHIPYLKQTIADTGYELDYIDGIHVEPMGVYSQNVASVDDIEEGMEVIISRSISDHGRILALFETQGLITLDESVDKSAATIDDIAENPLDLTFSPDVDPALLPEMYQSEEDALVAINTNYAIEAGLSPLEDALFIEDEDSEYVNVIAVRSADIENEAITKLVEVLQSEEIQNFILENYEGAVVPVGGSN
ncbi:MetQ/NlpA family ABC transporter substrate-binding protein [Oceanobacillus halophilus]|uniref:Lipoprotein n=1 Tax=Oceanobacillus halophilus TaxID=930130 RepID=A0A495A6I0_9BACI|nr:MetQ/NlpA family ABC transporter substrate-binding protein [Oceanobacillus halophilus]RKQ35477.1 methionine ABC transporter substrate-binding protein [Oceanobacillus halophilus]